MTRTQFIFLILLLTLLLLLPVGGKLKVVAAENIPFGGPLTSVYYCCNGLRLTVGQPRPGDFLFTFGSILHAYYNIFAPGPWVLGIARPGGICLNPIAWPPCTKTVHVDGTIIRVGTSGL